jgi:hypothetical protein
VAGSALEAQDDESVAGAGDPAAQEKRNARDAGT